MRIELAAVAGRDTLDEVGLHVDAQVGDRGVGRRHLEHGQVGRAQGEARIGKERRADARAVGEVDHPFRADDVVELDRRDVDRPLEGPAQGHDAEILPVEVPGTVVELVVRAQENGGRVEQGVGGGEAVLESGAEHERLEEGADLAPGLKGAVELAAIVVPASDHRSHRTGRRLEQQDRALDPRFLDELQLEARLVRALLATCSGIADRPQLEPRDIAPPQRRRIPARPLVARGLQHEAVIRDPNLRVLPPALENHTRSPGARLEFEADPSGQDAAERLGQVRGRQIVLVHPGDRSTVATQTVDPHQPSAQRLRRGALHSLVESRLHLQAALVQPLLPVRAVQVEADLLREVGRDRLRLSLRDDVERCRGRLDGLVPRHHAAFAEHPQDGVASCAHDLRPKVGRPHARTRHDRHQGRRLAVGQFGGRLAEVVAGRGFHAVVAVAEVGEVAVESEDLLLAETLLEFDREQGLPDLSAPDLGPVQEEHPRHLHGDRGGAREALPALPVLEDRAKDADDVEAGVGVEVPVLGGEQDTRERFRHLALGEQDALLDRVAPERFSVAVAQPGDLAGRQFGHGLDLRQIDHRGNADAEEHARDRGDGDRRQPAPVPDAPAPHRVRGFPRRVHLPNIIRRVP